MPAINARLEVRALSKTFGTVQVLTDVDLTVAAGEVHGVAGQNGSGKSTLIKILTGLYTPDPGADYRVDGQPMRLPVRWPEVHAAGVSVVHQDLGLLDQLTVAENICIGGYPTTGLVHHIDRKQRDHLAAQTLQRLGVDLEPSTLVGSLRAPERAEVAIARAMRDHTAGTGLIILDESTRALSGDDLIRVHAMLRRITADGSAAIMISHNLTELMAVTDRLTILRDGRLAGAGLLTRRSDRSRHRTPHARWPTGGDSGRCHHRRPSEGANDRRGAFVRTPSPRRRVRSGPRRDRRHHRPARQRLRGDPLPSHRCSEGRLGHHPDFSPHGRPHPGRRCRLPARLASSSSRNAESGTAWRSN